MADEKGPRGRATRIVATIASNAERPGALAALLDAGVDVVRLNGAHCLPGEITRRVALVRRLSRSRRAPTGVLLDLGGPKLRLGRLPGDAVTLAKGRTVELFPGVASRGESGAVVRLAVTYPALLADVGPGADVRLDDGKIRLRVRKRTRRALLATVEVGGRVKSGAGVNFPNSTLSAPALTAKDRRDLEEGLAAGVDFVGLSFVRSPAHVAALRRLLARLAPERRPWVVSKIERKEALAALDSLAAASDALMVARGDLGVEIGLASVPRAQREILAAGRRHAVPVIVATQMLESMIENPTPTRAEVSDVAGAVHDGADAVMLSGETAIGAWPVEAVEAMAEIARAAEVPEAGFVPDVACPPVPAGDFSAAVARTAAEMAREARAAAMVVYTESGKTARFVSKNPLSIPVLAFTSHETVRQKLTLLRDVTSFRVVEARTVEAMIRAGDAVLSRLPGLAGAVIVEISGAAPAAGATNTVRVRRVPR
ncbi:MAG: pyruvate kinase [Acidobacteriota bacterium]